MIESISKEYLLFAMEDKGRLTVLNDRVNFLVACFTELYLKEFINIENKNMYINKELSKEVFHLSPLYKVIKYSAAMKPKELSDYFLGNGDYFKDLFNSVKSSLIEDNRTTERTVDRIFGKDKFYIISNPVEIMKTVNNIKTIIKNKLEIDRETIIFLELLWEEVLEKNFSPKEFNYIRDESYKYNNEFIKKTKEDIKKRFILINDISNLF